MLYISKPAIWVLILGIDSGEAYMFGRYLKCKYTLLAIGFGVNLLIGVVA